MLRQKATDLIKLRNIYLRQLDLFDHDYSPQSDDEDAKKPNDELLVATQNSSINSAIVSETISECCASKDEVFNKEIIEILELPKILHQESATKLQTINRLKDELKKQQEKSFGLMLHDRELWTELDEMKSNNEERDETVVRLENQVQRNVQITKCVHEIFKHMILASKIDWSEDEELTQVMLEDVHHLFT